MLLLVSYFSSALLTLARVQASRFKMSCQVVSASANSDLYLFAIYQLTERKGKERQGKVGSSRNEQIKQIRQFVSYLGISTTHLAKAESQQPQQLLLEQLAAEHDRVDAALVHQAITEGQGDGDGDQGQALRRHRRRPASRHLVLNSGTKFLQSSALPLGAVPPRCSRLQN